MAARASGRMARRLVVIGGIWVLLQVYVGARLLGRAGLGPVSLGFAWAGVLLLALAPFAALFAGRMQGVPFRAALEWTGFLAMGLSSLLIVFTLAADVLHAGSWVAPRVLSVSVLGGAVALTVAGTWRARWPGIVRVDVPIANLPRDLEGFRIVQLSDLHVGATLKRAFVERVVAQANALGPDLVAQRRDEPVRQVARQRDEIGRARPGVARRSRAPGPARGAAREVLRYGEPRVLLGRDGLGARDRTPRAGPGARLRRA